MDIIVSLLGRINWIDVFVVIVLIRTSYIGLSRGFSTEIPRFLSLSLVIVLTYYYYNGLGQFLSKYPLITPEMINALAFIFLVVIFALLFKLVCIFVRFAIRIKGPDTFELVGGIVIGVIRGLLLASLILGCLKLLFPSYLNESIYKNSFSGPKIVNLAPGVCKIFTKIKPEKE